MFKTNVDGIEFDFNSGLRIKISNNLNKDVIIRAFDEYGIVIFNYFVECGKTNNDYVIESPKKNFIKYEFSIEDTKEKKIIFEHHFDAKNKNVLIESPTGAIGDNIAWIESFEEFRLKNGCRLYVKMNRKVANVLENQYKNIRFIYTDSNENLENINFYASYTVDPQNTSDENYYPFDISRCGVEYLPYYVLGLRIPKEFSVARLNLTSPRKIKERYICISTKASFMMKMWLYPNGWESVIDYLKSIGYRVLCIDRDREENFKSYKCSMPSNAEDYTGDLPLQERINLIKDCDFFVGLSSGLSWLANACKVPVVVISGSVFEKNEFYTPFRVTSYIGCNCCNVKMVSSFGKIKRDTCPKSEIDCRVKPFECQMNITPQMVIDTINKIPCVQERLKNLKKSDIISE